MSHIQGILAPFQVYFLYTRSKKFSPKNKKDLGMAYHIPPLKKAKKQGEMPLSILLQTYTDSQVFPGMDMYTVCAYSEC